MLRRSLFTLKVSRNWTKKSLNTKGHFPLKAVDPAELRDGSSTAKEKKVFYVTKDGDENVKREGMAAKVMTGVRNWSYVTRFQQPTGLFLSLMPCYWGTAMACTRALIFEGADPVVLCAPLLPLHLVVLFSLGSFTFRAAALVANDLLNKEHLKRTLSEEELAKSPIVNGTMNTSQAGGILAAHLTIGSVIALNLSPAALTALCATLPMVLLYPILQRTVFATQTHANADLDAMKQSGRMNVTNTSSALTSLSSNQLIGHAAYMGLMMNVGIFVGYGAVNNRIDWWLCGPAYAAAALWTMLYEVIHSYKKGHEARADAVVKLNTSNTATANASQAAHVLSAASQMSTNFSATVSTVADNAISGKRNPFSGVGSASGPAAGSGLGGLSPGAAAKSNLMASITNTNVQKYGVKAAAPVAEPAFVAKNKARAEAEAAALAAKITIGDRLLENKLLLVLIQFPIGGLIAACGVMSPQSIFFYFGLIWSSYYLSSIVDHANIYDRWSCTTAYKRNVKYAVMVLLSIMAGNAFWAYASEYEPHKDAQSISETSTLKSAISFGNAISPRCYDSSQFTWMDRFLKPAFVQGQSLAARGVPPQDIVIPAWMRREHFGENVSRILRFCLGGYVAPETIDGWEQWWYSITDHYNLLAMWTM